MSVNGLNGKVALVTGSSRGIGRAIVEKLSGEGASAVVNYAEREDKAQEVVAAIESAGGQAIAVQADVGRSAEVERLFDQTLDHYGKLDILVNNAGVAFHFPLQETPLKRWMLVLNVNLTGAFLCSKHVVPIMIKQKSGSIINIS